MRGVRPIIYPGCPTKPHPLILINMLISRAKLGQLVKPVGQYQAPGWGLGLLNNVC